MRLCLVSVIFYQKRKKRRITLEVHVLIANKNLVEVQSILTKINTKDTGKDIRALIWRPKL